MQPHSTQGSLVRVQVSRVRCQDPRLLDLTFKRGLKLLNLALQSDSLKLGLYMFNIIINIKNIIIFLIINIINIIINIFFKNIVNIKKQL